MATQWFEPDLTYLKTLIAAGVDGVASASQERGDHVFTPPLREVVWAPAAIGATVGALGTRMTGNRKPSGIAVAGLLGGLVGLGAALAWASRGFTGYAAHRALRHVNAARDQHWLETHPIDYA